MFLLFLTVYFHILPPRHTQLEHPVLRILLISVVRNGQKNHTLESTDFKSLYCLIHHEPTHCSILELLNSWVIPLVPTELKYFIQDNTLTRKRISNRNEPRGQDHKYLEISQRRNHLITLEDTEDFWLKCISIVKRLLEMTKNTAHERGITELRV